MEPRQAFRYAERCLYGYPESCVRLESLKKVLEELQGGGSVRGQSYEARAGGGVSDPVAVRAQRVLDTENEIRRLEAETMPIALIKRDLTSSYVLPNSSKDMMGKVLMLFYFGRNRNTEVAAALGMSERNVYRIRCALVRSVIRGLGL